jgi:hypothetical protein
VLLAMPLLIAVIEPAAKVLVFAGVNAAFAMTFTVTVQDAPAPIVPPVSPTLCPPAVATTVPPVQVVEDTRGVATTKLGMDAAKLSVNARVL